MSKLFFLLTLLVVYVAPAQDLIITGVIDGPLSGGTPKAVELYATADIADLSLYGIGSANNGGGTDGSEFELSGSATSGDFIYIATESTQFNNWFGFSPDFTSSATNINGDDAIELFYDATGLFAGSESVIDVFGEINVDGTGQPWDYENGWAYRDDATGPDGSTWTEANWSFSGADALNGESTNAGATTPFPVGSYAPVAGDNDPPVWSPTFPYLDNLTATSFEIYGQIDEPGTIYYVVIPNDAVAPSSSQVVAGSAPGGTLFSGSISVTTAFNTVFTTVSGLVEGLDYDVYVVAQDDEGTPNVQGSPIKLNYPPELIAVTEFLNNSLGSDALTPSEGDETTNEWIELYNYGRNTVDLTGWTISDEDVDSDAIGSVTIDPGDYIILTKSKAFFETQWLGGVTDARVVQLSLTLADGADEIILSNNEGDVVWSLAYPSGLTAGSATYLDYSETSTTTVFGSKATPGVIMGGNDSSGTTGYENTGDSEAYTSTAGDSGSPLDGQYASPLPVSLVSFEGFKEQNNASLAWKTASEINNAGFEIQKSLDGKSFFSIGFVKGNGTTNELISYSFVDVDFYQSGFYRLKQVDFDGKFELSQTIFIEKEGGNLLAYPNPFKTKVNFQIPVSDFELRVYDLSGILLMKSYNEEAISNFMIHANSGTYIMEINSLHLSYKQRIVKQ